MRKFHYRLPRHRTNVPVVVRPASGYPLFGWCVDVSTEGIGVSLANDIAINDVVTVEFALQGTTICATARVEYTRNLNYYGMTFLFASEPERDALRGLIESIYTTK